MSSAGVLHAVSEALRELLWFAIRNDTTGAILNDETHITLDAPFLHANDSAITDSHLSLFLYRVAENPDMKNRPLEQIGSSNRLRYPPLALDLSYLVTPLCNSAENDQELLGRVMQVLHDHGIVKGSMLSPPLANTIDELRVILNPMSEEDMTKLWSALMRPYRLSVSYVIRVTYVDSERETHGEPVRRKRLEVLQTPAGGDL